MTHHETSVFDKNFLNTIEQWFAARNDVFVVARFSRKAGEKAYFWFEKFSSFRAQLDLFPPETDVIVFRDNQFPLRGLVTDNLIRQALDLIPDNTEAMVVNTMKPPDCEVYVWGDDTHAELLETLQDIVGEPASIGFYAPWYNSDNETMISALVPLPDGTLKRGAY